MHLSFNRVHNGLYLWTFIPTLFYLFLVHVFHFSFFFCTDEVMFVKFHWSHTVPADIYRPLHGAVSLNNYQSILVLHEQMLLPEARRRRLMASDCLLEWNILENTKSVRKKYSKPCGTGCILLHFRWVLIYTRSRCRLSVFLYKLVNTITFGIVSKVVELFLM